MDAAATIPLVKSPVGWVEGTYYIKAAAVGVYVILKIWGKCQSLPSEVKNRFVIHVTDINKRVRGNLQQGSRPGHTTIAGIRGWP